MRSAWSVPGFFLMTLAVAGILAPVRDLEAQAAIPRDTLIAAAREIMEAARFCALVTLDESGRPQARTMDPFQPEEDLVVWLGTLRGSRKVREIRRDPRVMLYYQDPEGGGYVVISGIAELVDDAAERARRWKPEWSAYYGDREAD